MKTTTKAVLSILSWLVPLVSLAAPPNLERGQLLYENHCHDCHESVVHIREVQHAKSFQALHAQVAHWQDVLKLEWSPEDVLDVAGYLNATWYHHPE